MKIIQAKTAGFCYGVKRAVELAEKAAAEGRCYTLGPLIHNEQAVSRLREKGVCQVPSVEDVPECSVVIIRSHGATEKDIEALREKNCEIVDATCPNVSRIHKIVKEACGKGRKPIVIGSKNHPEVVAICGWCEGALVFKNVSELSGWLNLAPENRTLPITVVFQTTETQANKDECNKLIKKECTNYEIFDTICGATSMRQNEAAKLSEVCDAIVVIGGKSSANSLRLFEICAEKCPQVLFIETASELDVDKLRNARTVGITAGASTPAWIIKEVYNKMAEQIKDIEVISDGESKTENMETSFAELLEQSLITLNTGDKVKGVVVGISPAEILVDLGTKHSAYIPVSEFSDDPDIKLEDAVKVGMEIEAYVMRVNDAEGTVMLSKKRLDAAKNWEMVEEARANKTTVEGVVTEENKGGLVVSVKGVRVFVPASQTGLSKNAPMSELLKRRVKLRITEVNRSRRRVVGSIRAAQIEERKAAAEKIWQTIEVGAKYTGVVKSLTSYGAFVDIGGVDGMVHVSELGWRRTRNPAEVVKVGDVLEVTVLSFDKDKKRISLTCKDPGENPWDRFMSTYVVGSVVKVKIVKLMDFGAFAEIIPGVDGLIHISQIADRRIDKVSDVLKEGQEVEAKIIHIDTENKKVSLSIRALLEKEAAEAEAGDTGDTIVYDTDNPPSQDSQEE